MILAESGIYTIVSDEISPRPTRAIVSPFGRECGQVLCANCVFYEEDIPCDSITSIIKHQAFHRIFPNFTTEYPEYSI